MADNTSANAWTDGHYPPTLLDRLPTELLDMATKNIDQFDIVTHVNFCKVSLNVKTVHKRATPNASELGHIILTHCQ